MDMQQQKTMEINAASAQWAAPQLIELGVVGDKTQFTPGAPGADTVMSGS
jgi:hypothetical protein